MCDRIVQHMVGTYELIIMRRKDNPAFSPAVLPPFYDFQDNGRRQLIIEVVDMTDVRLKILQDQTELPPGLPAVDRLNRIEDLRQPPAAMEIHSMCIRIHTVSNTPIFMFHAKILNLMPLFLQEGSQFEYIGFTSSVRIEKLINH